MVDRTAVTSAVARFIAARSGETTERIHEDFDYVGAGLVDSLGVVELLFFVQDTFAADVKLGDIAIDQLNTAARVYDLIVSVSDRPSLDGIR